MSNTPASTEWSGSPHPDDPDNYWIDDQTGEVVSAATGKRYASIEQALVEEDK